MVSCFAAILADEHLKHQTIKCYLSWLLYFQITMGMHDPFGFAMDMPRLEYLLKGIRSVQARAEFTPWPRLPITPEIIVKLLRVWDTPPCQLTNECCGLCAASPSVPSCTLVKCPCLQEPPTVLRITYLLEISALITTRIPCDNKAFQDGEAAMASYLAARGLGAGPLVRLSDGTP